MVMCQVLVLGDGECRAKRHILLFSGAQGPLREAEVNNSNNKCKEGR